MSQFSWDRRIALQKLPQTVPFTNGGCGKSLDIIRRPFAAADSADVVNQRSKADRESSDTSDGAAVQEQKISN